MSVLFNRAVQVQIGEPGTLGKTYKDLRIAFEVNKHTLASQNDGLVTIYNLNKESRDFIAGLAPSKRHTTRKGLVTILAGYRPDPTPAELPIIFIGDIARDGVESERTGPDWVTKIKCSTSQRAIRSAAVAESFQKGTPKANIYQKLLGAMTGQGLNAAPPRGVPGGATTEGVTMFGSAWDLLLGQTKRDDLEVFVDDDQVIILPPDEPTLDQAVILASETGLIGTTSPTDTGVKARSLLQAGLKPGRAVQLFTREYFGGVFFKIEKVTHKGDTYGSDWFSDIEMKEIPTQSQNAIESPVGFA